MRLLPIITIVSFITATQAMAQENTVATAASSLEDVLLSLKQSADQLDAANGQLVARDQQIQNQIAQLQTQLGQLQSQGGILSNQANHLQEDNAGRSDVVSRLVSQNQDTDQRIAKAEQGIASIQKTLGIPMPHPVVQAPKQIDSPVTFEEQKEKLQLIKQIYDSQQRQEQLHQQIQEFQKSTPKASSADALLEQKNLQEQIKTLENEEASYPSAFGLNDQWEDSQLEQLQEELAGLEKNYAQLKNLMGMMENKSKSNSLNGQEKFEAKKLQDNLDGITRQNQSLRADLDELRSQLIELDKRKTALEAMVNKTPAN